MRTFAAFLFFCTVGIFAATFFEARKASAAESSVPELHGEYTYGVDVMVDGLTGCQYLRTGRTGITPRMGRDGKQICGEVLK